MSWQTRALAEVAPTPWRNGGGVTRELVAWPPGTAWDWRISVAEVACGGPFSRFEGVRRWLAILRGAGVRLTFGDRSIELTGDSAPLEFDGADPVGCSLLEGPVQDLNLMLRGASAASGRMQRVHGRLRPRIVTARTLALYNRSTPASVSVQGMTMRVPPDTLAWRSLPAGAEIEIDAGSAICMDFGF